ncbi:MAG: hypothetical protein QE487_06750 [Fluviicola sp.]|nr:hypothetical protein [Fluviicola sp.]
MLREIIEEFQLEEDVVVSRGESDRVNKDSELTNDKTMEQKWADVEDTGGDWSSHQGYVNNVDRGSSDKKF